MGNFHVIVEGPEVGTEKEPANNKNPDHRLMRPPEILNYRVAINFCYIRNDLSFFNHLDTCQNPNVKREGI